MRACAHEIGCHRGLSCSATAPMRASPAPGPIATSCRRFASSSPSTMPTALETTLSLFAEGVDDVVRKPIHVRELLARVGAIRRRSAVHYHARWPSCRRRSRAPFSVYLRWARPGHQRCRPQPAAPRAPHSRIPHLESSGRRVTKTQIFNAIYGILRRGRGRKRGREPRQQAAKETACSGSDTIRSIPNGSLVTASSSGTSSGSRRGVPLHRSRRSHNSPPTIAKARKSFVHESLQFDAHRDVSGMQPHRAMRFERHQRQYREFRARPATRTPTADVRDGAQQQCHERLRIGWCQNRYPLRRLGRRGL